MDTSVPAVVLNAGRDANAHGALGAIRSLGRAGVPVTGVHHRRGLPWAQSRHQRNRLIAPLGGADPAGLVELMAETGRRLDRPVLLATDDLGALWIDRHRSELEACFRLPVVEVGLAPRLANKASLSELTSAHGVSTLRVMVPSSRSELMEMADDLGYPVMAKSMDPLPLRVISGARSVMLVHGPEELAELYAAHGEDYGRNLMLQEWVPVEHRQSWILSACLDSSRRPVFVGTARKVRDNPPGQGATSYAQYAANPELQRGAVDFLSAVGYAGVVDTCWLLDTRDGLYKLLDVNPRVGANFRATARGDLDVVRALYLDLTGQEVPAAPEPPSGRAFVAELYDWRAMRAGHFPDGRWRWLRQIAAAPEKTWWSWSDPMPSAALVTWHGVLGARNRLTRRGR